MFAGFNIKEDYLSGDEDQISSSDNTVNNKLEINEGSSSIVDDSADKSVLLEPHHASSSSSNIVVINNNLSTQEDEDSFILITNSNNTTPQEHNLETELPKTQEIITESHHDQNVSGLISESVETSTVQEEIMFQTMQQSDQNEQSFENMERSFMAHSTRSTEVTSQTHRESLSILTSEDID